MEIGTKPEWRELSSPQAQLWFLHELQPADPAYNVGLAVELRGRPAAHVLTAAVAGVARRNPALRTRFGVRSGTAVGRVDPPGDVRLPIVQLLRGQDANELLADFARRPFDLKAGPPFRWCLLTVSSDHYVLALIVHHIVFDGSSVEPLVAELEQLAAAARVGSPEGRRCPPTPSEPPGETRPGGPAHLQYWREALAGLPPVPDLWPPYADGDSSFAAAVPSRRWTWEPSTRQQVRELARFHRCSPATIVLAGLVVLLHRYTGARDVVVGMPVDLRDQRGGIGHRVNVLPIRVRVPKGISFGGLLDAARDASFDALDHRDISFDQIVAAVAPFRGSAAAPLFRVMLSTVGRPCPPRFEGVATRLLTVPPAGAKYDLEITLAGVADSFELTLQADPRCCPPPLLSEFAARFQTVLGSAIAGPDTRVEDLPIDRHSGSRLLPARRRARVQRAPTGDAPGLYEVFHAAQRIGPDRLAVRARDGQLSYRALDLQVSRLASALLEAGAGPERVVAVCLPRELALPVALLAVARIGAAPLPLDPGQPDERLRAVVRESHVSALVGSDEARARCGFDGPVVRPQLGVEPTAGLPNAPMLAGHPEQSAYVLATSGSTGRPKAVVMRREGFAGLMEWARWTYGKDLAEVLVITSAGFDLFVFEMFAPLSAGGTAVLVDALGDLAHHPALRHATLVNTVPSVLETLLDLDLLPSTVRAVNVAGEPLEAHLVARVLDRRSSATVRNLYGPTEATTYVTATGPLDGIRAPTIGRAMAGARLFVSAENATGVPSGVPGELRIGGPPLARGYLNASGLTAAAFVPDPTGHGSRVYRSGDLVRSTVEGELQFLGRLDHQVKIRGVRIELGEIDAVLRTHPAVCQAAVMLDGTGSDRRLVGCVGTGAEPLVTGPDLAAWLSRRLPEVMIPRAWIMLDRLPVTANGKTDRNRLAARPVTEAHVEPVPPRTQLEAAVARCWHTVLNRTDIGVHDVFFDAGGTSLTLLRLQAELQQRLNEEVRLVDLFRCPTIAAQAQLLGGAPGPATVGAPAGEFRGVADGAARGSARRLARAGTRARPSAQREGEQFR